jgi:ribokinase
MLQNFCDKIFLNMENQNYEFDFIALGDITIDAFIKLADFHIHQGMPNEGMLKEVCLRFGDKIPYEKVTEVLAVGNSPNASVSASRLGLKVALITNLGDDDNGKKCLNSLEKDGVSTKLVTIHKNEKTNYHYVLQYGAERTILIKHEEYKYKLPELPKTKWLYLSSLGENSLSYHQDILNWLKRHPETRLAFQPGTFQIKQFEKLKEFCRYSHLFFCNLEEAQKMLETKENDIRKLLKEFKNLGVKIPVITDGPNGAYFYDGVEGWHVPIYPDMTPPKSRTGAGDAFASTFTSFLCLGFPPKEALRRAPINSMAVVQFTGAQEGLLSRKKLEQFLDNAPADYKVSKII